MWSMELDRTLCVQGWCKSPRRPMQLFCFEATLHHGVNKVLPGYFTWYISCGRREEEGLKDCVRALVDLNLWLRRVNDLASLMLMGISETGRVVGATSLDLLLDQGQGYVVPATCGVRDTRRIWEKPKFSWKSVCNARSIVHNLRKFMWSSGGKS